MITNRHTEALKDVVGSRLLDWGWSKSEIILRTTDGTFVGTPETECCAEAWIEWAEQTTVGRLDDEYIITRLDLGEYTEDGKEVPTGPADYDNWLETAFGTIYLNTGRITYELRCKSNGYYRGWLQWKRIA